MRLVIKKVICFRTNEAYVLRKTMRKDTRAAGGKKNCDVVPQTERTGCQTKKQTETPISEIRNAEGRKAYARRRQKKHFSM